MTNPFLLELPAVVSFSGGRTSGFMLHKILEAFGGEQPEGLEICFQNTGLEHPATYDFIEEIARRWGLRVTWLEYCLRLDEKKQTLAHHHRVVTHDTASRDGEPFTTLIWKKKYLPNPVARICTTNLKMRTMDRHLKTLPEFANGYTNAVGLRADEPRRAQRIKNDNSREDVVCPLYLAGYTEEDVLAFWRQQREDHGFDLMLPLTGNMAGNCVGCYLKGPYKLELLMEEMPEHFEWWVRAEQIVRGKAGTGARFRNDRPSYEQMTAKVKSQGSLFPPGLDNDTIPCMCTD